MLPENYYVDCSNLLEILIVDKILGKTIYSIDGPVKHSAKAIFKAGGCYCFVSGIKIINSKSISFKEFIDNYSP